MIRDISNGLEYRPIPVILATTQESELSALLGDFHTYITDSQLTHPDGSCTALSHLDHISGSQSESETHLLEASPPLEGDDDNEDDEDELWHGCSCAIAIADTNTDTDIQTRNELCTVQDGDVCDCVSQFGNFYSASPWSQNTLDTNNDDRILNIDALPPHLPLVECSVDCLCARGGRCGNRLSQLGVRAHVSIQSIESRIGLGLFYSPSFITSGAGQILPKGTFISLYAGEYLSTRQARERWSSQRQQSDGQEGQTNYILSLRLPDKVIHIDPRYKGNIGRFLNHSCQPNCVIHVVLWGEQSSPRAGIFTKRDVRPGEELTFDYGDASGDTHPSDKEIEIPAEDQEGDGRKWRNRTRCLCGAERCGGWMPFDETL